MKVTRLGYPRPVVSLGYYLSGGSPGQTPVANGSNGVEWTEVVQRISSNGSNYALNPFVNFAAGSNVILAVSSNTINIASTGGGGSLTVEDEGSPLTTAADTLDFVGAGVTASGTGTTKTITIPGGSGGLATSILGYNTAGGTAATMASLQMAMKKVTLSGTSTFLSIGAYISMVSLAGTVVFVAIYADSSGPSGPPLAANTLGHPGSGIVWTTPTTPGWLEVPISGQFPAGDYWIGFEFAYQEASWRLYYDGSGTDKEVTFSDAYYIEGITYRASVASASRTYSIRALIMS